MKKRILLVSSIFLVLDQIIKILVRNTIDLSKEINVIKNFFYITNLKNTGGAFSLFNNNTFGLAFIGMVVICFLFYYLQHAKTNKLEDICYSLLLGGIVGNLIDRLVYNGVTDYLGFVFFKYSFPVFNLADIGIVVSIIGLIINEIWSGKHGISSK